MTSAAARQYLAARLYTPQEVTDWLAGRAFPFSKYDGELGYLLPNRRFRHGVDNSICTYTYDASGARHLMAHADRPCRVNTYGNSFTHCDQVSDGETWQEVLAAHLGEPIRNFGIGGYSVYQAYLRMTREEARTPARYIIFNVYDDDHYRSLVSWQRLHFGLSPISFMPSQPHVRVDPAAGKFLPCPNPCPTPERLYDLCDLDRACQIFEDDFVLSYYLTQDDLGRRWQRRYVESSLTRAALFASQRIVEAVEGFAAASGRRVLYVLSYCAPNVATGIRDGYRFDHEFVHFLREKGLPYVDLLEAHRRDYAQFSTRVEDYLARYYIGHYTPLGNFFQAFAIKNKLVELLEPKPLPYQDV